MTWHILATGVKELFPEYAGKLGRPKSSLNIPVVKMEQVPAKAMRHKVGTNDGNREVLEAMDLQSGFDKTRVNEFMHPVSGDLGVMERIVSVQRSRRIEEDAYERFQHVLVMPGLFHTKMAAADAWWRTDISPEHLRSTPGSIYEYMKSLNPKEIQKMTNNPRFRMLHIGIEHILTASLLECWRIQSGHATLQEFQSTKPTFEALGFMAKQITARWPAMTVDRDADPRERDIRLENAALSVRDALYYRILSDSMNYGEIGLVEDVIWHWIPIFKGTRKHKYAAHLTNFLYSLREVYPAPLARAVRMNWVCNPRGHVDGHRGLDWYQELNNMYHKVSSSDCSCP